MLDENYIIGLVDGEGSFSVYVRNPKEKKKTKRRVVVEPRFYLKLQEGDEEILWELKKFFRCGNVYFQRDKRKNHKDCFRYEVANRKDLKEIIIPFFKRYPPKIPSKKKDFEIFCQIMERIERKEHLTKKGLEKIYYLKQKMH